MVLSDLGARVIRIDRPDGAGLFPPSSNDVMSRGRESVAVDLKTDGGREVVLRSAAMSDALVEGFRPGVTERLGVGPAQCLARNPALIYGRMTGWGQEGPMSGMAGHDIDYIALTGALNAIGTSSHPVPPLNLVGDFGGGGMLLAVGVLAGIINARETGVGQVVDAAMTDGSALLTASHRGYMADGWWTDSRGANLLDGGAPFYATYATADGGHVAVGALEPQFFAALLDGLGISDDEMGAQNDRAGWPAMRERLGREFARRSRDDWAEHFDGTDACVAPVLSMSEAPHNPHNRARSTFVKIEGVSQPAPAPRFDQTPASIERGPVGPGADTDEVLAELGFSRGEIGTLREAGAVA
jgi:alpha-methylacyl-CoA racemase